jgi:RHH-type proline utilization regulon transcriptional repressor/proline dehydrogenase/delta 1-pyrroline-5-carboxylate dehydrogenase
MRGKGVFIAISPWNFPLAIFTGQVTAALAAGNAVLAKPAAPTPLIAYRAIQLLHEAGVPTDVLHFVPGSGRLIGERAVADPRVAGVVFTGSTEVAQTINQTMAHRDGPILWTAPLCLSKSFMMPFTRRLTAPGNVARHYAFCVCRRRSSRGP